MITTSAVEVAKKFVGQKEVDGPLSNPTILAMLRLEDASIQDDATAWCSAFVNFIAYLCGLPRSKSLLARSWLNIGIHVDIADAKADCDVVILSRGNLPQPGPDVINAPGHVGFFMGRSANGNILILGGNQGDAVSIESFNLVHLLDIRRLA
jgi:uncharacterized protein (TIGR02594 family)